MLFIGSVCAIIASVLAYRKPKESWPLIVIHMICEMKFGLLAAKEILNDWINAKYNKNNCPPQTGRVAIITGGSRGIGADVVKMLLELDMEVIIACRTPSAGEKAILQIRESGVKSGQAKVYQLDNSSLESVKQFAAEIKKNYTKIHVLINNAGIMFGSYKETGDGFEEQWAVNYLSHFLLTILLLPLLKAGSLSQQSSRIVNVSSCAHLMGKINFKDINNKQRFVTGYAYAQSKLAQEVFTKKLQSLLIEKGYNINVYSVHPGIVFTDLFVHSFVWKCKTLAQHLFKTPQQGAVSIAYAAVNQAVEHSGGTYISNCLPSPVNPDAVDVSVQSKLIDLSLEQVQLKNIFEYM
ncbi:PREDICTED: retinol dehydrogenase 12-like [Dufourea novaeangliae]|uniref:Dehydrogenase/reductase SDR family member on chromosome X n=1 Tax=Dufourea novaeangliae TaxID=178035 RepID=A0A154NXX4_DUFNO|nr:PREDICTED: retinol dehydrogenase 12-like [Dufourea novaeangliae]KZC04431.1 Dehydrogenase/reductase SDR family member on chromosome X [Dufourea novaeangliae]